MTRTILFIFGTRPEAIKLSPLILHLRRSPEFYSVKVCVTAQHRGMLDQVLEAFGIQPDYDLNVMLPGQTLVQSASRILGALEPVFSSVKPDLVMVQGDTTTTFCGALAAFYSGVPVAHVEAGLRTGDLRQPFPEELNRVLASRLATLHFAATQGAARNLAQEGIARHVWITGNTGIDAVLQVRDRLDSGEMAPGPRSGNRSLTRAVQKGFPAPDREEAAARAFPNRDREEAAAQGFPNRDREEAAAQAFPNRDREGAAAQAFPNRDREGAAAQAFPNRDREEAAAQGFPNRDREEAAAQAFPNRGREEAAAQAFPNRGREGAANANFRNLALDPGVRMILVTAHRRESFGEGFERICQALAALADRPDVHLVYPVHPNPNVLEPVQRISARIPASRL